MSDKLQLTDKDIYKDYLIVPVFNYDSGKRDFQVYPDSGNEPGWCFHNTTRDLIMEWIDAKVECENKKPQEHE